MTGMAIFKIGGWVGLMLSETPAGAQKPVTHERVTRAPRPARPARQNRFQIMEGKASVQASPRARVAGAA